MFYSECLQPGTKFFLALAVFVGVAQASNGPHLMVQKSLLTNRPFAGKDLPVRYRIYNVGSRCLNFKIVRRDTHTPLTGILSPVEKII
jgi:hypothetical protein